MVKVAVQKDHVSKTHRHCHSSNDCNPITVHEGVFVQYTTLSANPSFFFLSCLVINTYDTTACGLVKARGRWVSSHSLASVVSLVLRALVSAVAHRSMSMLRSDASEREECCVGLRFLQKISLTWIIASISLLPTVRLFEPWYPERN